MNLQTIGSTIQLILAPVVMVTSCGIIVSGMLTHYISINTQMRTMARERLELLRGGDGRVSLAAARSTPFMAERLDEIDRQLPLLLRRHQLVHNAVLAIYVAIFVLVTSMFFIAFAAITRSTSARADAVSNTLAITALIVFLVGSVALFVGVALFAYEIRLSSDAVSYEVGRIMHLGEGAAMPPSAHLDERNEPRIPSQMRQA